MSVEEVQACVDDLIDSMIDGDEELEAELLSELCKALDCHAQGLMDYLTGGA